MIDEYLKHLYETEIDTSLGGVAKVTFKDKRKGDREEVEVGGDAEGLGIIKASVGTKKKVEEAIIGSEDEVVKHVDVASGVIVRRDDNNTQLALLIKRASDDHWPNVWEFPRGKCDKPIGESILKCAKREIKEETGLDINPDRLVDRYEYIADHGKRKSTCHVFVCSMDDPSQEVKLSKEHQMYKWVSEAGVTEIMLMPDQKRILAKVLNPERKIMNYPEGKGPKKVEEYLQWLSQKKN
jgi:mutator protein MutT